MRGKLKHFTLTAALLLAEASPLSAQAQEPSAADLNLACSVKAASNDLTAKANPPHRARGLKQAAGLESSDILDIMAEGLAMTAEEQAQSDRLAKEFFESGFIGPNSVNKRGAEILRLLERIDGRVRTRLAGCGTRQAQPPSSELR